MLQEVLTIRRLQALEQLTLTFMLEVSSLRRTASSSPHPSESCPRGAWSLQTPSHPSTCWHRSCWQNWSNLRSFTLATCYLWYRRCSCSCRFIWKGFKAEGLLNVCQSLVGQSSIYKPFLLLLLLFSFAICLSWRSRKWFLFEPNNPCSQFRAEFQEGVSFKPIHFLNII